MKKVLAVLIGVILCVGLLACSNDKGKVKCENCGKKSDCQKIVYQDRRNSNRKETHYVCSENCRVEMEIKMERQELYPIN